jgi:hypothetical protein
MVKPHWALSSQNEDAPHIAEPKAKGSACGPFALYRSASARAVPWKPMSSGMVFRPRHDRANVGRAATAAT